MPSPETYERSEIQVSDYATYRDLRSWTYNPVERGTPYLATEHLVLLPGLDGTGELFVDFIEALPESWTVTTVSYPTDRFLPYADLRPFLGAKVPKLERFVLIAESFSAPLAVWYAANNPPNLAAVVICAGFVRNPVPGWSGVVKAIAKPWLFRLKPPRAIVEYFLLGPHVHSKLLESLRHALQRVSPEVLSGRVHEVLNCDARNDLRGTTVPLLYLDAANDKLISSKCKKEFSQLRPDTVVRSVPAPHLLLQREAEKAATIVKTFVSSLPSTPE